MKNYAIIMYMQLGLWLKVDASRRRNDPRKAIKEVITEHGAA